MQLTNKDYEQLNKKIMPKSKAHINVPKAFAVGGTICMIGQGLLLLFENLGFDPELAATATSCTLIMLSALLTGLNVYDNIARHAGAGTLVPITGFANAVVSPALEFRREGLILGVGAKIFAISGPVIVYGLTASVIYGIIAYILGIY